MHGQLVHTQIVRRQVQLLEDLIERHGSLAGMIEHDHVPSGLDLLLDEAKQVLLVHARGRVNVRVHFSHIVEVPVRHRLLLTDLLELVEHAVQLELGLEVLQASVAEGLQRAVADQVDQQMVVVHEHLEVSVDKVREGRVAVCVEGANHPVDHLELEVEPGQDLDVERVAQAHRRMYWMVLKFEKINY